jgi:DNA invertase Pin-like site-specific DNA recombinase
MSGLEKFVPVKDLAAQLGRPIRVALLERRSKLDDDTKSIEVQHEALLRFLATLDTGSYVCDLRMSEDGGDIYRQIVSAWQNKGQNGLLARLMDNLGRYDVILVHRMDRFGRNARTVLNAIDAMEAAGVRMYCVEQDIDSANSSQEFLGQIHVILAQQSSTLSSQRILENKARAKTLGGWRGGAIVYGYRKSVVRVGDRAGQAVLDANGYKVLEIDPAEATVIRSAVDDIVDGGRSTAAVVRDLNGRNVPTSRGTHTGAAGSKTRIRWSVTTLRRILRNPALRGFDVVGAGKDRFEILKVDGKDHRPNEPILSDERWNALQLVLTRNSMRRRPATEALLAGLVTCAAHRQGGERCGRRMYGPGTITANSASYGCRTSNILANGDPEKCRGNAISAQWLNRLVETTVVAIAANPQWQRALDEAYRLARQQAEGHATDAANELAAAVQRMAELRAELRNAKSAALRDLITDEVRLLDVEIGRLEVIRPDPGPLADVSVDFAARWERMGQDEKRAVICDLVERIEVGPATAVGPRFDPSRVRLHLRHIGVLHITDPVADDPLACPECGQLFDRPMPLGVHRRYRHGVIGMTSKRPIGQTVTYACPEPDCDMTTTVAGALKRHTTAKHGIPEALVCAHGCPKVFASRTDLASHIRGAHADSSDASPTECHHCGKLLRGAAGLRIHQGRVHPGG